MLGYVTIGYREAEPALAFYDAVLGAIGLTRAFFDQGWAGYGPPGAADQNIYLCPPFDGKPAHAGNGIMIAFRGASKEAVEAAYRAGLDHGGSDEGAPGPRPADSTSFYGCYLRDPTGNKISVFCRP
ncbi:MAG: VOC family protein [Alphaproteobacteria bacterium]|nr:VOC family protein [Alphaproteobacteria bacterium]